MQDSREESAPSQSGPSPALAERLLEAAPSQFFLTARGKLMFNEDCVASLFRGKTVTEPELRPHIEGAEVVAHLRQVVAAKVDELVGPLRFEGKGVNGEGRALLEDIGSQLREGLGSVRARQVQGAARALRGAAQEAFDASLVVVGRRHIYLPENLKAKSVVTRLALMATFKDLQAPDTWKPTQVLVLDQEGGLTHLSGKDFEHLGYELFGKRAVRVDVVERVIAPVFIQKIPDIFPTLMHTFRCSEDEARSIAKALKIGGSPEKRGARRKQGDEGRTKSGRNRSGGRKSGFRQ